MTAADVCPLAVPVNLLSFCLLAEQTGPELDHALAC